VTDNPGPKRDANYILHQEGKEALRKAFDSAQANAKAAAQEGEQKQQGASKGLPFELFDDFRRQARKEWLVEGLLGAGEASSFFGEPGCGKSVLAEDLGLHVAAGLPWLGRAVKRGAVLYLALERPQLVKRRGLAYGLHAGMTGLPFALVSVELDLRGSNVADQVAATCDALKASIGLAVALIIIDTISRGLCGGDENSPKDIGSVVRTIGRINALTGAHVLCVHHTPADGANRQRGHSSLKGGLDTTIHVEKAGSTRTATVTKANDSEEGDALAFTLESVEIDRDQAGNVTTAPIVAPVEGYVAKRSAPPRKLNDRQKLALEALSACAAERGKPPAAALGLPASIVSVITVDEWRDHMLDAGILDRDAPNPREDFRRVKAQLQTRHLIAEQKGFVWRCSPD
jgi:hypothetical protein